MRRSSVAVACLIASLALARAAASDERARIASEQAPFASAPATISLRSPAFGANEPIPDRNSAYHENESPALTWSGVPEKARSLVLVVEDPDAPGPTPFTHWLVADLPTSERDLPAAVPDLPPLAVGGPAYQGRTSTGRTGYFGPRPPAGPPHHYHFQLFALDVPLRMPPGFDRDALLDAMRGHVLARGELVGTYQRVGTHADPEPGAGPRK